ncbi:hypothetical protein, partial [Escherichia coli]
SLKTSIKTITYLSDIGCLEIQGASLCLNTYVDLINQYTTRISLSIFNKNTCAPSKKKKNFITNMNELDIKTTKRIYNDFAFIYC